VAVSRRSTAAVAAAVAAARGVYELVCRVASIREEGGISVFVMMMML
jgi:hypothetical protein